MDRRKASNPKVFSTMGVAQLGKPCLYAATCAIYFLEICGLLNLSAMR